MIDKRKFANPPKEFRPSPFWSWNDSLAYDELSRQVRDMKEKGFGGYFMHSRGGLITEYLSDEWIHCVRACIEEGKEGDMESWMYDEDKWPSGFAGGLVPELGDKYRAKGLQLVELRSDDCLQDQLLDDRSVLLAVFGLNKQQGRLVSNVTRLNLDELQHVFENESLDAFYAFRIQTARTGNKWFNGQSYVDLLDPKVTRKFLDITYTPYEKAFQGDFGEFVPGMFTDEPCALSCLEETGQLPWTGEFAEFFRELYDYDIVDKLPLLFFEASGHRRVKYDYWKAITLRFVNCYTRLCYERCEEGHLMLTGHFLFEERLNCQIPYAGAVMPHYEYLHVPGIDHLGKNIDFPLKLKQVSSVAHQFGRKRVLCEIFGMSGHDVSFEEQKWIADFHFALGITFINQHLTPYSIRGERKRDFAPIISYHQPYWEYYRYMNDYFARCSYFLQQGEFAADILLLHPIGSAWAVFEPEFEGRPHPDRTGGSSVEELDDGFDQTLRSLLSGQFSFDLGDEIIMERYGKTCNGILTINQSGYKIIMIPPSLTIASSTFDLLKGFTAGGGIIITIGRTPDMVDAERSEELVQFLENNALHALSPSLACIKEVLSKVYGSDIVVLDDAGNPVEDVYCHHRIESNKHLYFFCTHNENEYRSIKILLQPKGKVAKLDPSTGEVETVSTCIADGKTLICTMLPPVGSLLYIVDTSEEPDIRVLNDSACCPERNCSEIIELPEEWDYDITHPNSVVLDFCRYAFGSADLSDKVPLFKVRQAAFERFELERWQGIQPWCILRDKPELEGDTRVRLEYEFESDISSGAWLIVEKACEYVVIVNEKQICTDTDQWHWDRQFSKLDISDVMIKGTNTVQLTREFDVFTELEDIYLVGDFGVKLQEGRGYVLTTKPERLKVGDWVEQGYPFYAGNMIYRTSIEMNGQYGKQYVLGLSKASGSVFEVRVNGQSVKTLGWKPWTADITQFLKNGKNTIEIVVGSTLRNIMGPLHIYPLMPDYFRSEENWVDEYDFVSYGLLDRPKLFVYNN